jgi:hypothetical protein
MNFIKHINIFKRKGLALISIINKEGEIIPGIHRIILSDYLRIGE